MINKISTKEEDSSKWVYIRTQGMNYEDWDFDILVKSDFGYVVCAGDDVMFWDIKAYKDTCWGLGKVSANAKSVLMRLSELMIEETPPKMSSNTRLLFSALIEELRKRNLK